MINVNRKYSVTVNGNKIEVVASSGNEAVSVAANKLGISESSISSASFEQKEVLASPEVNPDLLELSKTNKELKCLIDTFEGIHEEIHNGSYHEDNDHAHYVYEAAAQALYGKNYFEWINKVID